MEIDRSVEAVAGDVMSMEPTGPKLSKKQALGTVFVDKNTLHGLVDRINTAAEHDVLKVTVEDLDGIFQKNGREAHLCLLCPDTPAKVKMESSSSSIFAHLRSHHSQFFQDLVERKRNALAANIKKRQRKASSKLSGAATGTALLTSMIRKSGGASTASIELHTGGRTVGDDTMRKYDEAIIDLIVERCLPFEIVNSPAFAKMVTTLTSGSEYVPPSSRVVSTLVKKWWNAVEDHVRMEVKTILEESPEVWFFFTMDGWSRKMMEGAFNGIEMHYSDPTTWEPMTRLVAMHNTAGKKAEHIMEAYEVALKRVGFTTIGLRTRISGINSDSASNNKKFGDDLKKRIEDEEFDPDTCSLEDKLLHQELQCETLSFCNIHLLQLAIKDSIAASDEISFLLVKIKSFVRKFHSRADMRANYLAVAKRCLKKASARAAGPSVDDARGARESENMLDELVAELARSENVEDVADVGQEGGAGSASKPARLLKFLDFVETRWGSDFMMLDRVIEIVERCKDSTGGKELINGTINHTTKLPAKVRELMSLTDQDVILLRPLRDLLAELHMLTRTLEGHSANAPSFGMFLHTLRVLRLRLLTKLASFYLYSDEKQASMKPVIAFAENLAKCLGASPADARSTVEEAKRLNDEDDEDDEDLEDNEDDMGDAEEESEASNAAAPRPRTSARKRRPTAVMAGRSYSSVNRESATAVRARQERVREQNERLARENLLREQARMEAAVDDGKTEQERRSTLFARFQNKPNVELMPAYIAEALDPMVRTSEALVFSELAKTDETVKGRAAELLRKAAKAQLDDDRVLVLKAMTDELDTLQTRCKDRFLAYAPVKDDTLAAGERTTSLSRRFDNLADAGESSRDLHSSSAAGARAGSQADDQGNRADALIFSRDRLLEKVRRFLNSDHDRMKAVAKQLEQVSAAQSIAATRDPLTQVAPSAWWRWWASIGRTEYPYVAVLARRFLYMQASEAGCERAFSIAKDIAHYRRAASLSNSTFESQLLLRAAATATKRKFSKIAARSKFPSRAASKRRRTGAAD